MESRLEAATSGQSAAAQKGFGGWIAGRANRRSYWLFVAPSIVVLEVLSSFKVPGAAFIIALPVLFAMIRRLHDLGRSGWFAPVINVSVNVLGFALRFGAPQLLGGAAPTLIYYIVLLVLGLLPGDPRANEFGPPSRRGKKADLAETFS